MIWIVVFFSYYDILEMVNCLLAVQVSIIGNDNFKALEFVELVKK